MSAVSVSGTARSSRSPVGRRRRRRATRRPSATSIRTVSTAYSGMPSARATIASTACFGQARHEPGEQLAHRRLRQRLEVQRGEVALAGAPIGPPLEQLRPGQGDDVDRRRARLHSSRWSMKSSRPESAKWRSSKTRTTGRCRGDPLEERPPRAEQLLASRCPARCRAGPAAPARSSAARPRRGRARRRVAATFARVSSPRRRSRAGRPGARTISPSAQKVMPSPYAGDRPSCHQTVSTRPSRYFRNSQASRLLPMPAGPDDATRGAHALSRPVAWNRSLSSRSSSSRPTNGASRRLASGCARRARRRPAARAMPGPAPPCP